MAENRTVRPPAMTAAQVTAFPPAVMATLRFSGSKKPSTAVVMLLTCLVFFAFSTIIGWNFYGEQCLRYLTGGSQRAQRLYRWCYLAALCTAPLLSVKAAWELADILNACMALPNLTALLLLWRQVVEGSRRPAGKT